MGGEVPIWRRLTRDFGTLPCAATLEALLDGRCNRALESGPFSGSGFFWGPSQQTRGTRITADRRLPRAKRPSGLQRNSSLEAVVVWECLWPPDPFRSSNVSYSLAPAAA